MTRNRWDDHYARQARKEKWLARSVFKLREMDQRFQLLGKGSRILDLGCHPGSWSQYAIRKTGPQGAVVGVDLTPPEQLSAPNFRFIQGDVLDLDPEEVVRRVGTVDLVLSDMAPRTTGVKDVDAARSFALAQRAGDIALMALARGGHFVCKVFSGADLNSFKADMAGHFRETRLARPSAVRKKSKETYLVALDRRENP